MGVHRTKYLYDLSIGYVESMTTFLRRRAVVQTMQRRFIVVSGQGGGCRAMNLFSNDLVDSWVLRRHIDAAAVFTCNTGRRRSTWTCSLPRKPTWLLHTNRAATGDAQTWKSTLVRESVNSLPLHLFCWCSTLMPVRFTAHARIFFCNRCFPPPLPPQHYTVV